MNDQSITEPPAEVVGAVRTLQDDRDELLELLGHVVDGLTYTSRDDVALIQIPAGVFAAISERVGRT